ncbi:tetratricopeptide repeat protein [Sulfitobacter sp. F26169L]|uniref:tetratricopeptide repeat protein n=1 Tax=Sulfitobacter sp. F26169L TaxID=2996015 RepID=UPI002260831C|nr:tetratricopeptide repeat protein [Sulfitobacter sp. F26169L]MCX7567500.1 tetratricopeptide repeat protein [Sulfitobacter sp. F26169L]
MRIYKRLFPAVILLSGTLLLAACDSPEERAEKHFQNAIALIQDNDVDRAIVELRNVFELNSGHIKARQALAELHMQQGNERAAFAQYSILAERDPDDYESRIQLAQLAFNFGSWDEMDRLGTQAMELAPDDPRVKAIALTLAYREAANDGEASDRREMGNQAIKMLEQNPESLLLRSLIMDHSIREQDFARALAEIDWLIGNDRKRARYYQERLRILAMMQDSEGIETQLREMVKIFPEDSGQKATLIRYLVSQNDLDGAEAFLRELVDEAAPDETGAKVDLIRFLAETGDLEKARKETAKAISESNDPLPFQIIGAGFDFTEGKRTEAIAALQNVLETSKASGEGVTSEQTDSVKVLLAEMLLKTGNEVGARTHVEELLAENSTHPKALKMQAAWQIDADETGPAIAALRLVLDQNPDDADAMTLMANAYSRTGEADLAKDFLAQAVQASGNAPSESLRYASVLIDDERYLPAEDVLIPALRLDRTNTRLLSMLGQLYLRMEDYGRATGVIDSLRRIGGEQAIQVANGLEAEQLNLQKGPSEAMAHLEGLANETDATVGTRIALVRARISTGDLNGALALAKELREADPDSKALLVVLAVAHTAARDYDAAASLYKELIDDAPRNAGAWLRLSQVGLLKGDREAAKSAIDGGLTHAPEDPDLLWARASIAESDGDIETAIKIYEILYEQNSSSTVVANNLASLLSTYRTDEASQARAWTIGRRLRGSDFPALQDTYAWLLHQRGDSAEALPILESAAEGLPADPIVQYHLGQVYLAVDRSEEALEQFRKSIEIAGPADSRPQIEEARKLMQSLQNPDPAQE